MKRFALLFTALILTTLAYSQTYGNEWINYNQDYYKFKVGTADLFRISQQTLKNAGINVGVIDPRTVDIYRNGVPVDIYVSGESDGSLDSGDFIEFLGKPNDGALDEGLYRSKAEHTNPYESLYADSAVYFLTWGSAKSSYHLSTYNDPNFVGKSTDNYFLNTVVESFKSDYFEGIPNNSTLEQQFSEYTYGEGFCSSRSNTFTEFLVKTPGVYNPGPDATLEVLAFSRNNPSEFINGFNHSFGVAIGDKSNILKTSFHNGYSAIKIKLNELTFSNSNITNTTKLYLGETDVINRPLSYHTIPYFKIQYPRKFDLFNSTEIEFNSIGPNGYFEFENYESSYTSPVVYDFTNKNRISGTITSNKLQFNTKGGNGLELYINDEVKVLSVTSIRKTNFTQTNAINATYLIITHKSLANGAIEYKDYRESITGGGYSVITHYASDLYNEFSYGYHHPIGIRNGINFLLDITKEPIENILLLGKGQVYTRTRFNLYNKNSLDLVPTLGTPPSDYLFVSPLDGSSMSLRVPIGRLPARSNNEITIYLNKVKAHEASTSAEWYKSIIQIVGGKDARENSSFRNYLDEYFNIARDTFLGAKRIVFSKNKAVTISTELVEEIQKSIDSGATLFNYFGHGSATLLEVDIGAASTLNNHGKYPFFIFNGCALGNAYVQSSKGEEYLFEQNNGAINWLAGTGYGYTDPLRTYTRILHEELIQKQYGASVGNAVKTTIERYQNLNNGLNVINSRQLVYLGDPALKLNLPKLPDALARNAEVITEFSAIEDVRIKLDLINIGKTTIDSVWLTIHGSNGSKSTQVFEGTFAVPNYTKTLEITLDKTDIFSGLVRFTMVVDPVNSLSEDLPHGETNNSYSFEHLFELLKPLVVKPLQNSIVSSSNVDFIFNIANQNHVDTDIEIQLDTSPSFFNDGIVKYNFNSNKNLINYSASIPPLNGKDFFYRIRTKKEGITSGWSVGSFAYIFQSPTGWSEQHYKNFNNVNYTFLIPDSSTSKTEFARRISNTYSVATAGGSRAYFRRTRVAGTYVIYYQSGNKGIEVVAYHPNTEKRISQKGSKYNLPYINPWGYNATPEESQKEYYFLNEECGLYNFKSSIKENQDSFLQYLKSVPDGYHIQIMSYPQTGIETWEQEIFQELKKFGIYDLEGNKEGAPFALFGTKNNSSFPSIEKYADYQDTVNSYEYQLVNFATTIKPKVYEGVLKTELIGPATSWGSVNVSFTHYDSEYDAYYIDVIGINKLNNEELLFQHSHDSIIDISSIDSKRYPYLKLKIWLRDSINFTPITIDRWTVLYEGVTEGAIDIDILDELSSDTIERGQYLSFATAFTNVSRIPFDTSLTLVKLISSTGQDLIIDTLEMGSIATGQTVLIRDTINSEHLSGSYKLLVTANFDRTVTEDEYLNNLYYKSFFVTTDNRNPQMDVTFDGIHILNKDIVSPNVIISITGLDDNKYLLLDDPSLFELYLRYPNSDSFFRIDPMDPNFTFIPSSGPKVKATATYRTEDLISGLYTLKVRLMDKTGNGYELAPYMIDFKVITKQSITNIYPYPNPFTTCAKFVFTATGMDVPDQIKINIYTITGRLVKQIDQDELGPIRIGNNLTDYCWDGTDDYGDKLANGVYLYKAEIRSNGKLVELSETSSDHLFNNGFGKLYIAR